MEIMQCPVCGKQMVRWKETRSFDRKRQIEYQRIHYRCEADDTWGRYEIPVGPMQQSGVDRESAQSAPC
ncbi:MAG TPA: hypothetical protein VFV38_28820 [Ktedonobacteraceae bacterium]|nr:hypothetical protein [Ktedonobacteraceae bacterium]